MEKKYAKIYLTACSALISCFFVVSIQAAPLIATDAHSLAQGGTGVASSTSTNAVFYNPAMLATFRQDDDFSLETPIVSGKIDDQNDLYRWQNDFRKNNYIAKFSQALINLQGTNDNDQSFVERRQFAASQGTDLLNALENLSHKNLEAHASSALIIGIPSKKIGISAFANMWGNVHARAIIANADVNSMESALAILNGDRIDDIFTLIDPIENFTSFAELTGLIVTEFGFSIASEETLLQHQFTWGITPKFKDIRSYDYKFIAKEFDQAEYILHNGEKNHKHLNFDMGIAGYINSFWNYGFVIKDVIPRSLNTALNHTIELKPQARIGIARTARRTTFAFDYDLTETQLLTNARKYQFASVGTEIDFRLLQLRLGYRYNLPDAKMSELTAGFGLWLFGIHADMAIATNQQRNGLSAAAQLGIRF